MHGPINVNPLNTELNPICHLLALLGAHHILHVIRVKVKSPNNISKWQMGFNSAFKGLRSFVVKAGET
jgi:hypothetical protein